MGSSLTIKDSILFLSAYIKGQRFNVNNMQPAIGAANIVLGRILGPPCIWRQNRQTMNFPISTGGGQDYNMAVSNLGRIETQWLMDGTGKVYQLTGATTLARTQGSRRPTKVAPQYDDNAGNITFRFNAIPDGAYTAYFDYQAKATLLTSYASTWAPIPDEYSYIYNQFMLAWGAALVNDARFPIFLKEGLSALIGAQGGLDEQSKAIFIGEWMDWMTTVSKKNAEANAEAGAKLQA